VAQIIVTADDFGLDEAVNEAVEDAFRHGILTTAALMVGQPATDDAVRRARRLPGLAVGLHLAVTRAMPVLPPAAIPHLVGRDGQLASGLLAQAVRLVSPAIVRELRAEIAAQFDAYAATGLTLDHVSVHQHLQVHPVILAVLLDIGPRYGMTALRWPFEPWRLRVGLGLPSRPLEWLAIRAWTPHGRARIRRCGLAMPDAVAGIAATGHLTEDRWCRLIPRLTGPVTEVYCHPATRNTPTLTAQDASYERVAEWRALTSPRVRACVEQSRLTLTTYSRLGANGQTPSDS
jgi:hopanoid biosynthesis associated protein HpnK